MVVFGAGVGMLLILRVNQMRNSGTGKNQRRILVAAKAAAPIEMMTISAVRSQRPWMTHQTSPAMAKSTKKHPQAHIQNIFYS